MTFYLRMLVAEADRFYTRCHHLKAASGLLIRFIGKMKPYWNYIPSPVPLFFSFLFFLSGVQMDQV